MYSGFVAYNGVEVINNDRAAAYAAALGITAVQCHCGDLRRALGDAPYTTPENDDAPWYDESTPGSADFAGFVGLDATGVSKSVAGREAVPLITGGSALHPLRRKHREVQFSVLAIAKTECGLSYGFSWLAAALRGDVCGAGCDGDDLCFFTCCPICPEPEPEDPEADDPCYDWATQHWRTLRNCGLLEMSDPTDVKKIAGGWIGQVTFTIAAGDPYIYREPVTVIDGPRPDQIMPNYTDPGTPPDCIETADCLRIPGCPPPPAPILPPIPVDPCFPRGEFTAARVVMPVPRENLSAWSESVPLITIRSGNRSLRRLTLRWYDNALGLDCVSDLDPCAACAEVNVAMIPRNSTFVLDGRTERATVDCPGGPGMRTAEPALYGRHGTPFVWPVFSCNGGACLEIIAQANTVADNMHIEVAYVQRQDAA